MTHFSQEYLDKLIAEHKLVSVSFQQLKTTHLTRQTRQHGSQAVDMALANLAAKKVELEAFIDTLNEYLNG